MTTKEAFEAVLCHVEVDLRSMDADPNRDNPYLKKLKEAFDIVLDYKCDLIRGGQYYGS